MRIKDTKKVKDGDILYSVDPQRLTIGTISLTQVKNGFAKITVSNISHSEEKSIQVESFPVECDGLLFFETRDEAVIFVKTQIGL